MNSLGVTVLHEGTEPIKADMIFVHGMRGGEVDTWITNTVCWPRDLLPTVLPFARILT